MPDIIDLISSDETENIAPKRTRTPKRTRKLPHHNTAVTPPKQKCLGNENKIELSPNTLLARLDLGSPRNSDKSVKKLFDDEKFKNARQALHSQTPEMMPGREKELSEIENFIQHKMETETAGTLYVSGPPGTGKTAALSKILKSLDCDKTFKELYINCTSVKSASSVFARIAKELSIKVRTKRSEKEYLAAIENYLSTTKQTVLMVLDEIDQLDSRHQSVLYTIFEWPIKPNNRIVLIGIANALDFTDRTLPRLQSYLTVKPKLLYFAPYTKQQIIDIFNERLKSSNVSDVFPPAALQMLAAKVSAVSGDVRRALDISRRAIELAEHTKSKNILKPTEDNLQDKVTPKVELKQVVDVLNNVYGTNINDEVDDSFPLQQKLLLCSLVLMLKKGKKRDILVGKLHEVYKKVCTKRNLVAVDQSEFVGLCSLIETRGILKVQGKKAPQLNKVCLEWDEDEVADVLKDKKLLSSVLDDDSVLTK